MRTGLLVAILVVSGAGWFVHSPSWVRPAALAVFAIAAAVLLWGRSGGARRQPSRPSTTSSFSPSDGPAERPEASKEMWDALDRGEDPTNRQYE
jgi:uncharacterized membrane protein (TIGR02234 family)